MGWTNRLLFESDDAIGFIDSNHQQVVAASGGKTVLVSEAGWPDAGSATATPANAAQHFREFVSWARATNTGYLYFAAFDEQWKGEGGVGPHWGIWDTAGTLKTFDEPPLAGEWEGDEVIAGPGTPSIAFTFVPAYGAYGILRGQVQHVVPNDYRVSVFIRVGSQWWMKPFELQPRTWVRANGTWACNPATHPNDLNATEIIGLLGKKLPCFQHTFGRTITVRIVLLHEVRDDILNPLRKFMMFLDWVADIFPRNG